MSKVTSSQVARIGFDVLGNCSKDVKLRALKQEDHARAFEVGLLVGLKGQHVSV